MFGTAFGLCEITATVWSQRILVEEQLRDRFRSMSGCLGDWVHLQTTKCPDLSFSTRMGGYYEDGHCATMSLRTSAIAFKPYVAYAMAANYNADRIARTLRATTRFWLVASENETSRWPNTLFLKPPLSNLQWADSKTSISMLDSNGVSKPVPIYFWYTRIITCLTFQVKKSLASLLKSLLRWNV